jgi:AcrR family transcriptional regulator
VGDTSGGREWRTRLGDAWESGSVSTEKKPRQRLNPAERRTEIIAAATRLISERGYRGVTLEAIANEVGITKAGLQHHFTTKTDLLISVLKARDDDDLSYALNDAVVTTQEDFLDRWRASLQRTFERREIIRLFTVLAAESLDENHPAHDYFERRMEIGRREFREYMQGWFHDPAKVAVDFMSYLDGLQLAWLRDPTIDFRGHGIAFMRLLLSGDGAR